MTSDPGQHVKITKNVSNSLFSGSLTRIVKLQSYHVGCHVNIAESIIFFEVVETSCVIPDARLVPLRLGLGKGDKYNKKKTNISFIFEVAGTYE